ncbi:hypothetical protein TNIN_218821 [Trichonephila inaurata madagascariensis]|uniref:Uncharacterized protein n=1 Tax=Trichonephila inaurata madagascariensis TaxID=2747483 RepID=A0A8X7BTI6_9ARAC|nr:hypothetical protein TNIN_218821 [Trichonephila inaurata madagascariensis]
MLMVGKSGRNANGVDIRDESFRGEFCGCDESFWGLLDARGEFCGLDARDEFCGTGEFRGNSAKWSTAGVAGGTP